MTWNDWRLRLRALLFRGRMERELQDELDFHVEMQAGKHRASGMEARAARERAARELGNTDLAKEESRDVRGVQGFDALRQDLRSAVRGLIRSPLFTLTAILTIGVGLGLNATVFTFVNTFVLQPIDVRDPHSLYEMRTGLRGGYGAWLAWTDFQNLDSATLPFDDIIAFRRADGRIADMPAGAQLVSGNYFQTLGIGAALGRTLLPSDIDGTTSTRIAVLNHRTWMTRFGGDSGVLGQTVWLEATPVEIVGVAREGFGGLREMAVDFWAPLTALGRPYLIEVVGRLRPGTDVGQAQVRLLEWARRAMASRSQNPVGLSVTLEPRGTLAPKLGEAIVVVGPLTVAFGLVLLMGCANVASMMLARGLARQPEIGVRLSLGASRARVVRLLLTEGVILALPAALAGLLVSRVAVEAGSRMFFAALPPAIAPLLNLPEFQLDYRVVLFVLLLALLATMLFGLAPALQVTRSDLIGMTRQVTHSARPNRLRNLLVTVQVAVCTLLLVSTVILIRGVNRADLADPGIRTEGVLTLDVSDWRKRSAVLEWLRADRDVLSIAVARGVPLTSQLNRTSYVTPAGPVDVAFNIVSSGFFTALEIPLIRGRTFMPDEERLAKPVAIVSEAAAALLWPGADPLGRVLRQDTGAGQIPEPRPGDSTTIVRFPANWRFQPPPTYRDAVVIGIVRNISPSVRTDGSHPEAVVYLPIGAEIDSHGRFATILLSVRGDAELVRRRIDRELFAILPGSIDRLSSLSDFRAELVFPVRIASWIGIVIGTIALLLTVTGIYGVLAYLVEQRKREIGIRMALGSAVSQVVRLVLGQSLRKGALGAAIGALLALNLARILASELRLIDALDLVAYVGGIAIVLLACVAAGAIPARRAAGIDPATTLRQD